jgi:hypothetical protein
VPRATENVSAVCAGPGDNSGSGSIARPAAHRPAVPLAEREEEGDGSTRQPAQLCPRVSECGRQWLPLLNSTPSNSYGKTSEGQAPGPVC